MLEGKNLAFRYRAGGSWIFQDLNISIAGGERVGLPGPSGRGKSTLARVLAGYLQPVKGNVMVEGKTQRVREFNPVQKLFQHPELAVNPRWKIRDILYEAGIPQKDLLQEFQINNNWLKRYPHELSGGELQRVCLVRALNPGTSYLICDEITSMLDPLTQASIWKAVLQIAESRQIGMLVISHDQDLLDLVCQRRFSYFETE